MAEASDQQERTERATPKRREEARKKGQVAKSMEVNSSAILLVSLLFLYFGGSYMLENMQYYCRVIFENYDSITINLGNIQGYLQVASIGFLKIILPFIATILFVGLAINYAQVGFFISFEPLQPKFSKVNPLQGIKRVLFSKRALVELLKGIFKIIIVGGIAYLSIKGEMETYPSMMDKEPSQILIYTAKQVLSIGLKIAFVFLILALLDFMFQKYDYEKSIRMTKQEVKEEFKQLEGDPKVKARIRRIQIDMARRRMMEDIPEADVVITNPTHVAVALKYRPKEMDAPTVVAKGREKIAHRIKQIAEENDIPVVEDKPLAWALFKSTEIGDQVPEDLFQAVAEVLAYVYRLKNKSVS